MTEPTLEQIAQQLGLRRDQEVRALEIGARILAHRITRLELGEAIGWIYRTRDFDERCASNGCATPAQMRRLQAREAQSA